MSIALWIVQALLLGMYGMAGGMKAFRANQFRKTADWAEKRSDGFLHFIGGMEILGALGMILPMVTGILPWLTPLAALGLALIQLLAILTVHIPGKEFKILPMNAVLLALSLFVLIGRWGLLASQLS